MSTIKVKHSYTAGQEDSTMFSCLLIPVMIFLKVQVFQQTAFDSTFVQLLTC